MDGIFLKVYKQFVKFSFLIATQFKSLVLDYLIYFRRFSSIQRERVK